MREQHLIRKVFTISGYVLLVAGGALIVAVGVLVMLGATFDAIESALLAGSAVLLMTIGFLLIRNYEPDEGERGSSNTEESRMTEKIERVQKFLESDLPTLHRLIRRSESLFSDSLQRMSEERQRFEGSCESLTRAIVASLDDLWRISKLNEGLEREAFDALCKRLSNAGFVVYVPEERSLPDMNFSKIIREKEADLPRGSVVEVINPGYRYGERLIREAEIVVASRPSRGKDKKK